MADAVFPWEKTRPSGKRLGPDAVVPPNALVPYPLAQDRRSRDYLWLRRCPACGKARLYRARAKTCSRKCGNSIGFFRASKVRKLHRMLPKMHRLATQARIANMEARIAREVEGLTPLEAWKKAYDRGYAAGHAAGKRGYVRLRDKAGVA